eukprot:355066-Chlamydomonas_euryale.AAC.5
MHARKHGQQAQSNKRCSCNASEVARLGVDVFSDLACAPRGVASVENSDLMQFGDKRSENDIERTKGTNKGPAVQKLCNTHVPVAYLQPCPPSQAKHAIKHSLVAVGGTVAGNKFCWSYSPCSYSTSCATIRSDVPTVQFCSRVTQGFCVGGVDEGCVGGVGEVDAGAREEWMRGVWEEWEEWTRGAGEEWMRSAGEEFSPEN